MSLQLATHCLPFGMYYRLILKSLVIGLCAISLSAQAQKSADTAQLLVSKINMPQLGRMRTLNIYLPAGYASSKKKYPVIYMHDGQNIFSISKNPYGSWNIDSLLKTVPAGKQVIIIGIDNGGNYRMGEYNAYDSKYAKAEGAAYTEFIVKTLKPHIDSVYRTKKEAKYTTVAGSSMGGLISMYAIMKYPDVFGAAGVFSPSFWIAPQIYTDIEAAPSNSKARIFLTCGDQEGNETDYVNKMDSLLMEKGFDRKAVPAPLIIKGGKHNEAQWHSSFTTFYSWLIK